MGEVGRKSAPLFSTRRIKGLIFNLHLPYTTHCFTQAPHRFPYLCAIFLFETPSPLLLPLLCTHYSRYILTIASSLMTSLALLDTEMLLQMVPGLQFFDFAMPVSWVITRVNIQNTTILFFSFSTGFKKLHETVHTLL